MTDIPRLIETLLAQPGLTVQDAGEALLRELSQGSITAGEFRNNPRVLVESDGVPRYLAQMAWRALAGDFENIDEVIAGLHGVWNRNPPTLESRSAVSESARVVIPEARVLRVRKPVRTEATDWETAFEAHVTSGVLRDTEIEVRARTSTNPSAAFIIPYFWLHATVAAYNLVRVSPGAFEAGADTFFVIEPLRQVNATTVARSLACPKPQIDQVRRGRGDLTVHTLKGMVVHAILDRLIEGADDIAACYDTALSPYLAQMAALVDQRFDEEAFRADSLRHAAALKEFVDSNPHMRQDAQVELRRYSATIGIQGRIDAVFKNGSRLDVVELKTGKRIRPEDHAQLFIYRLLLSDYIRRVRAETGEAIELTARLVSSYDGTSTPLRPAADFLRVLETRNRLIAYAHALAHGFRPAGMPYADYDAAVCGVCPSWTRARCLEDSALFGDLPDAPDRPDVAYFRRFSSLVQRESWRADQDLADLLDESRLEFRLRNFRTIAGARFLGADSGGFAFEFDENRSDLGAGDRVLIHAGSISSGSSFHGRLRSIDSRQARVAIPLANVSPETFAGREWTIDRLPSDYTSEASQTALYDFLRTPMDARKRAILGDLGTVEIPGSTAPELDAGLNPSQSEAVRRSLGCATFHLIWGPPGTGKTRVIPEIVARTPGGVLMGAFTNTAVDKMLGALLDRDPEARFVRLGRSSDSPELADRLGARAGLAFSEDLAAGSSTAAGLRRAFDETPIIAATAHRAATHPYVRGRLFELAVVDEAGQLTEPLTLGVVMRARRFVLIGDDRQLPPVVRTNGLDTSLFERLKAAAGREAPDKLTLLDVQYRMHPEIMSISNRLYYGGAISAGISAEDRRPPAGQALAFIPVESFPEGRSNLAEAHAVAEIVRSYRRRLSAGDIGVISPFRAQVVLLRQLLHGTGVTADTVERFQGGEREMIVISFVRARGSGFVFDDRRFNVAVTRARRKLVLVAHPELFRNTKYEWFCGFMEAVWFSP